MTDGTATAPLKRAHAWARSLLDAAPWTELTERLSLLLTAPPAVQWAAGDESAPPAAWLIVDAATLRSSPPELRAPLLSDGAFVQREPDGELTVFTLDALSRLLDGTTRRSLELRWTVRHAEPLHDPLRRHEELSAAAVRLPDDAYERIVRPLYLQAVSSLLALVRPDVAVAGEAAAALTRLACVLEDGIHPPPQWLMAAVAETELGARIGSWLDDLPRALGGDEVAGRRVVGGGEAVRRAVDAALRPHFGTARWFKEPDAYALRQPH